MLLRDSEDVERREISPLATRFYIELRADAPKEFCRPAFRRKHPGQKKQIACLHSFHIGSKWFRRRGELDVKFFQPLLGAGRPRTRASYWLRFRICIHGGSSSVNSTLDVAMTRQGVQEPEKNVSKILVA
jgi:hypothetical protein